MAIPGVFLRGILNKLFPPRVQMTAADKAMRRSISKFSGIGAALIAFAPGAAITVGSQVIQGCADQTPLSGFQTQTEQSRLLPGSLYSPSAQAGHDNVVEVGEQFNSLSVGNRSLSVEISVPVARATGWKAQVAEDGKNVLIDYRTYLLENNIPGGSEGFGRVAVRSMKVTVNVMGEEVEYDVFVSKTHEGKSVYGIKAPNNDIGDFLAINPDTGKFIDKDGQEVAALTADNLETIEIYNVFMKFTGALSFALVEEAPGSQTSQPVYQYVKNEAGKIETIPAGAKPENQQYAYINGVPIAAGEEVPVIIAKIVVTNAAGRVEEFVPTAEEIAAGTVVLDLDHFVEGGFFTGSIATSYQIDSSVTLSEKNFSFNSFLRAVVA